MQNYTAHQARYFAEQIMLKRSQSSIDGLASAMSGVKVDLNPHQVDAALFAMKSPLSSGALLADEVGLGKTIEAGLAIAQFWSERKRKILLIVPASLRMQWRSELAEKFFIDSVIMESTNFNRCKKAGHYNPFDVQDKIIICSYDFAARKEQELSSTAWDLVIIDEAHRLRNVYKSNNVTANKLRKALVNRKKLLLTATPLQNNLMELYGLVSIIDEHVFGDAKTFKEMYVSCSNPDIRNFNLRQRLQPLCKRTLRKQVTEYVQYTHRHALLQEYTPTEDEEKLYNAITEYLQTDKLYALPEGQRTLITMVLRKLLASSSFAIAGTLASLVQRLEGMLHGIERELDMSDFDTFGELEDGEDESSDAATETLEHDRDGIQKELERLRGFAALAQSITFNDKGNNLLKALEDGFRRTTELGGQAKAVIFTESRRTQNYLMNLLSNNGYDGQIVFLNGVNNDEVSKRIYTEWKERHKGDGRISGSKQADMKDAIVEEFRDRATILIGTEAAAEGINLQFCSLVVNYDLPWNPQRIEQRIGRCHRYGQKNDVVVINFLNRKNAADVRVYQLLDEKFKLFSGVFGSSDEVLGSIESGMDFEKRIAKIYQKCKDAAEIEEEFNLLQEELAESINERMVAARQSILENFDEEVAARLKNCAGDTTASLDKFTQWMYHFFMIQGAERVQPLDEWRFRCNFNDQEIMYCLRWKPAEEHGDIFLRKEDDIFQQLLKKASETALEPSRLVFRYSYCERKIGFLDEHIGLKGILSIDKLIYNGLSEEEHLVFSIITEDGTVIDDEMMDKIMQLPCAADGNCTAETQALIALREERMELQRQEVENANREYYLAECDKLDAYSEDLKNGLQHELKDLKKLISDKKKEFRAATSLPLEEMLKMKDEINKLDAKRKKLQREIYDREDAIDAEKEQLQAKIREKLKGNSKTEHIMTVSFEIA